MNGGSRNATIARSIWWFCAEWSSRYAARRFDAETLIIAKPPSIDLRSTNIRSNEMRRFAVVLTVVAISATALYGQNLDVIKQRRETMRAISGASGPIWKMYTGKAPFELAKVQSGLKTMSDQFGMFKSQFPDDSKKGGDTDAKPLIWSDKTGFNDAVEATIADIKKAAASIKDEESFKEGYRPVAESCGGCHTVDGGYTIRLGDSFKKPMP